VPRLLAAPDKFRGTASATDAAAAMIRAAHDAGWEARALPISDGGEGLVDCFGGANRHTEVSGPLGAPVVAGWRLAGDLAVVEMAAASGIELVGERNDPVGATTRGTGELIAVAIDAGARTVIVGAGGSATTDGGRGAVEVLRDRAPLDGSRGVSVIVAADVRTPFVAAAYTFARQKGANDSQVAELAARLESLVASYLAEFGRDIAGLPGAGAAGGLGGGLAALGATIRAGFDVVAEQLDVGSAVIAADLVITGEGQLDATSLDGKATGAMIELSSSHRVPAAAIVGRVAPGFAPAFPVVELVRLCGADVARSATLQCIERATATLLPGPATR
jgi:glycerate kinase